ncbi:MAG: phenylalanine--tRNA ligase subunit alpha [Bacteroidota bacterium]|nr:phenylalanine--tRNA ligase subunit alpha [Bacteroidota bacterium]
MLENIQKIIEEAGNFSSSVSSEIEQYRIKYLGKKGILNEILADFQKISKDEKKEFGKKINELKTTVSEKVKNLKSEKTDFENKKAELSDLSLPGKNFEIGSRHPISLVRNEIIEIFKKLGFSVSEGPEIEDDYHVFTALNFPPEHPARDMQDTFFIEKNPDILLRTHTSSVQVRVMENEKPPIRTISPGRVFRNEAISSRSHCIFHQVEGLYVDTDVSFADLKQTLLYFAVEMFGKETKIRLRPSFFPFTEPSAEMDISCSCGGKGCALCKHTGWLEILGCGMVDPAVLKNNHIDPQKYTGFAFGMGIERIALLKYQINDIRLYFENDVRFLKQFSNAY